MWGLRTVIPFSLRQTILTELHEGHPGIAHMKSIARSHVWWPKIDQEIEKVTRECQPCNKTRKAPPASPLLPWSWPTAPWQRVHIDFATHQAKHYLIMVDAHSKWPEVIGPMKTTTADSPINAMRNIFARYGLRTQVVSDDGPPFQSAEYEEFLRQNDIQRILVSSYHPSSNGRAERLVQTFKSAMGSSADDPASSIQRRIQNFLLSYRSKPHATIGSSPAKLFLLQELRSRLSLVKPDIGSRVVSQQDKVKSNDDKFAKYRKIEMGDSVLPRDHLSGQKWQAGTVVEQTSPASFQVQLNDGRNWRRCADDVLQNTRSSAVTQSSPVEVTSDQSTEGVTSPSTESSTPPTEKSESVESPSTPAPPTPAPRRSKRATKPPQRLIEEMD